MKTLLNYKVLWIVALVFGSLSTQAQLWTEDFETDQEGVMYFSTDQFNDGTSDHYGRTDGTNISGAYSGQNGTFFWAGEDLDDNGAPSPFPEDTITFIATDVTGVPSIIFRGLFAEGSSNGWDDADFVSVEYNMDGAGWNELLYFSGVGGANSGMFQDTNNDGIGDGASLEPAFAEFEATVPVTGLSLELRIIASANSASEEFAFDYLRLYDASTLVFGCTDPTALNYNSLADTDDGSCYHISIDAFQFGYTPNPFTIGVGQTVRWVNIEGTHNVDGTNDELGGGLYNNPENFFLATGGVGTEWLYTFNVPGEYDYNCSVGVHAALGMVGSFTVGTGGCTNPAADNYNSLADFDDGSCVISGCTDSTASNYNPDATVDDGSCVYVSFDLVINEIHYNPCAAQGNDTDFEFVEIYNNDAVSVDLEGFQLVLNATVAHTFAPGVSIAAGEYIIVTANALSYSGNGYQVFEFVAGATGNTSTTVTILSDTGGTVDTVSYTDSAPWPTAPDGDCNSLELSDPNSDNSDPANWYASYVLDGTPGAENSSPSAAVPYTIVQLQTEDHVGETTLTSGIVTCVFGGAFTMQDGTGANSGIWVNGTGVLVGDDVTVEGLVAEIFDVTTISASVVTVNTSGNALPAHEVLGTLALNDEQWEGVLVQTTGVCDDNTQGFGEWSVDDGSGPILIDDLNGNDYSLTSLIGTTYTVSGPLYFSFGNYKITPCDNALDIQKHGCTDGTAANYDADAAIDDGSCILSGCTYALADNYNPGATIDDGSCTFNDLTAVCTGDSNGDGVVNVLDLVAVSSNFGAICD